MKVLNVEDRRQWEKSSIGLFMTEHLTVETGICFILVLTSLTMRLWSLNSIPLTNLEARVALDSLAIVKGDAISTSNPMFAGLLSVLLSIFGSSNFTVRIVSAIAGSFVCMLPLLAKDQMGRYRALTFASILVFSPTMWFVSRQAEGQTLAWAIAGSVLFSYMKNQKQLTAILLGLLMACGKDAMTPVLVLAASLLIISSTKTERHYIRYSPVNIASGVFAFIAACTMFLWRSSGLGDAFYGISMWVSSVITPGNMGLLRVVSGLLIYEPFIIMSAIIGTSLLIAQQQFNRLDSVWIAWIVVSLIFVLLNQSREPADLLPLVIGCAALATHWWVNTVQAIGNQREIWQTTAVVVAVSIAMLVYAYLGLSFYAEQQQITSLIGVLLGLIMIIGTGVVCTLLADWLTALRSIMLAMGICLVIYTLGAGFQLTQVRNDDPAEAYISEAIDTGLSDLVNTIAMTSLKAYGDPNVISLQVQDIAPPALKWALRDQLKVTYVTHLTDNAAILSPSNIKPQGPSSYTGASFRVTSTTALSELRCQPVAPDSGQLNCTPLVHWFTRRIVAQTEVTKWILWLDNETALKASGIQQ